MSEVAIFQPVPDDPARYKNYFLSLADCKKPAVKVRIEDASTELFEFTRVTYLDADGKPCGKALLFKGLLFGIDEGETDERDLTDSSGKSFAAAGPPITGFSVIAINEDGSPGRTLLTVTGAAPIGQAQFLNSIILPKDPGGSYQDFVSLMLRDATRVTGSAGDDGIEVGAGNDSVTGKGGDDIVYKWKTGNLNYDGGAGSDTLSFEPADGDVPLPIRSAVADFTKGTGISAFGGKLVLKNVENVSGTKFADNLRGNAADNNLDGGSGGADTIRGLGGDDLIGIDPNYVNSKPRKIIADGGAGHDSLTVLGIGVETLNRLDVLDQARNTGTFRGGQFLNFEQIFASSDFSVTAAFEILGGNGAESIRVGSNADTVSGRGGNDTIDGAGGGDKLFGGAGIDTLNYNSGVTVNLATSKASGGDAQGDVISGFENVIVKFGLNVLTGSAGANILQGGGADTINGGGGNDQISSGSKSKLSGGAGNDRIDADGGTIDGGAGHDVIVTDGFSGDRLSGGAGVDRITGGFGQDIMSGGAGADRFIFTSTIDTAATRALADAISDFRRGQDGIDLSAIDAKAGAAGNNKFAFIGAGAFSAEGQVRVAHAGGDTFVEMNIFGKNGAESIVKLDGNVGITAADFIL